MRLRIVTWNVHRCIGSDRHYSPERVASVLKQLQPDIVALQEVDSSLMADGEIDQLTAIANGTGLTSLMGPTLQRSYGVYGNALLYRFDLESAEEHDLSYRKFEPRGALAATLKIDGERSVRVVNTHLGLKYWERVYQIKKILSDLTWRNDGLTILAGDFNEWLGITPNSYRLSSAFPPCKKMLTFPSRWPRFALDRIFISGNVQSYEHFVADFRDARLASDHLPVVADLLTT